MYPLKFEKYFIKKIWGGRAFEQSLDMEFPTGENFGESWEVGFSESFSNYV